jgi:hypothetical protein
MKESPADPPLDADAWTDEQWIEWLRATDPQSDEDAPTSEPVTLGARAIRTSGGSVLGSAMTAVANIIYEPKDPDAAVVAPAPNEPEDPEVSLVLDPQHPEQSIATIRSERATPSEDEE